MANQMTPVMTDPATVERPSKEFANVFQTLSAGEAIFSADASDSARYQQGSLLKQQVIAAVSGTRSYAPGMQ